MRRGSKPTTRRRSSKKSPTRRRGRTYRATQDQFDERMQSVGLPELINKYESEQNPFAEPFRSLMKEIEAEFLANATVSIETFQKYFKTIESVTQTPLTELKEVASIFGHNI